MKRFAAGLLIVTSTLFGQSTRNTSVGAPNNVTGAPLLGYMPGPGPLDLQPILGSVTNAHLDAPISLPDGTTQIFLPPRQQYLLLESQSDHSISVWAMGRSLPGSTTPFLQLVAGAITQPDIVAFSPKGSSAALYSKNQGALQVVIGLPGMGRIRTQSATSMLGDVNAVAVSDDGAFLVAQNASGLVYLSSSGNDWRQLPWNGAPIAWTFIPASHEFVVIDSKRQTILFSTADLGIGAPITSLAGFQPDDIAVTSDGTEIVVLSQSSGKIVSVALKDMAVQPMPPLNGNTLFTLRDGHTFLLSAGPGAPLIRISGDADSRATSSGTVQ